MKEFSHQVSSVFVFYCIAVNICTEKYPRLPFSFRSSQKVSKDTTLPCIVFLSERERENYAEKGGNPFLHMLREWTLT